MPKIKKGDIVTRNSYGNDIIFFVDKIIKGRENEDLAILKGITIRIEASAYLSDLHVETTEKAKTEITRFDDFISKTVNDFVNRFNIKKNVRRLNEKANNCIILHLDGDKLYAEKANKIYNRFKLNAIVKNIKENKQPFEIRDLLNKYNPDILVVTGHDGMIKKGYRYNDIYNYRNSRYFAKTVQEARLWENNGKDLAIFAGACQSYYELLIGVGANFASSPSRILIDFMDPLVIAQKIANTDKNKFITINNIKDFLRDGDRGISGIGCYGKYKE